VEILQRGEVLVSSSGGPDICHNAGGTLFHRVRTAMAMERSANFSDEVRQNSGRAYTRNALN